MADSCVVRRLARPPSQPQAGLALELLRAYIADCLPQGLDARETWMFGANFFMVSIASSEFVARRPTGQSLPTMCSECLASHFLRAA
jgi:hypothetical protein